MILSHERRYIFIHSPKTAGTSVEIFLARSTGPRDVVTDGREDENEYNRRMGWPGAQNTSRPATLRLGDLSLPLPFLKGKQFKTHHAASKVRASIPGEVWKSYFKFTTVRNPYDRAISLYYWKMRENERLDVDDLNRFVASASDEILTNWWMYADSRNRLLIDHAMRYERLIQDLTAVSKRLGIPLGNGLPAAKSTQRRNRRHYSEVLGSFARARIEDTAHWELETFGYTWQNVS